jgi:hypothetical protein
MASFVFNNTALRLTRSSTNGINPEADTFYGLLVTSTPNVTWSTRADVTGEVTGGTYVRKDLVKNGTFPALSGANASLIRFTDPLWTALWATTTQVAGLVILKGTVGATSPTDFVVVFNEIQDNNGAPAPYINKTSSPTSENFTFFFAAGGSLIVQPG